MLKLRIRITKISFRFFRHISSPIPFPINFETFSHPLFACSVHNSSPSEVDISSVRIRIKS